MNDTEILTSLQTAMRVAVRWQQPASPRLLGEWANWIDQERQPERRAPDDDLRAAAKECAPGFAPCKIDDTIFWMGKDDQMHQSSPPHEDLEWTDADRRNWYIGTRGVQLSETQRFWRCEHHPSAIDNWDVWRGYCGHGCDKSELRSWDNGTHREP
jgi:hypothetical protein